MIDETETRARKYIGLLVHDRQAGGRRPCRTRRLRILPNTTPILTKKADMANDDSRRENAERIAIEALGFVAADPELLPRFLAITGIEAQAIRQAAREPGFLAGVLQFILAHEPTLLRFAHKSGLAPADVAKAIRNLPLGNDQHDIST
jgi:Protein of unknown function (DUF3572)